MLDHTNIITYVESYEDKRYMYIVMEYFKQASELKTIIENFASKMNEGDNKRQPILPENDVCHIMHMLVKGLCHIH